MLIPVGRILSFFLLITTISNAAEPLKVSVEAMVDEQDAYEKNPLKVEVLITHPTKYMVDIGSFRYEKKPVKTDLLREQKIGNNDEISIYTFTIPGQKAGFYWLEPVEVSVQGAVYRSVRRALMIANEPAQSVAKQTITNTNQSSSAEGTKSPLLKLQAYADTFSPLYPGQRTVLTYRYLFSANIDLTAEHLPMLEAKGFKKIGDLITKESQKQNVSILEAYQQVEAVAPGVYTFGPSYIEGYAYSMGLFGKKTYLQPKLRAEAPNVVITVEALPSSEMAAFDGAVGQFTILSKLLTSDNVEIGDAFNLEVIIRGKGEMSSVEMPKLLCQPGFAGLFDLNDTPIAGALISLDAKRFEFELRPLSAQIKEIPSITFSYFNPQTRSFEFAQSEPISVTVKPLPPGEAVVPELFKSP